MYTFGSVNPDSYIPKPLPEINDASAAKIASNIPAGKLKRNMPRGMNPFWTPSGAEMLSKKTRNARGLSRIPAPTKVDNSSTIKVVRDLPKISFPPVGLSGLEDFKFPLLIVLGLLIACKLLK